jgi:nicotinic acid mononucleotide adenylyltransferase
VPLEISSTQVRQQLLLGESEFVSSEVMEYIKSRGLYCE